MSQRQLTADAAGRIGIFPLTQRHATSRRWLRLTWAGLAPAGTRELAWRTDRMPILQQFWRIGILSPDLRRISCPNLYRHGAVSLRQNPPPAFMGLVPGSTQSLVIQEQQQITRLQRVLRRSASAQSQRKGPVAPCSWTPQKSQVERCEHQDDSNIHCQPFPESVSEEHEIYTPTRANHSHLDGDRHTVPPGFVSQGWLV
jgi:hypothetical protein